MHVVSVESFFDGFYDFFAGGEALVAEEGGAVVEAV